MTEEGPSFAQAMDMIKKSRSQSLAGSSSVEKDKDKIVYEIPDLNESSTSTSAPKKPVKSVPSSPTGKSDVPFLPPRPPDRQKSRKYDYKPVLPTPVETEPIEKKPIRLAPMPKYLGKNFKVPEFADKLRGQFPVAVKVSRGFYGDNELYTLSEGEKFIVCFLTDYETVCGVDMNGSIFEIPVNDGHLISLLSERIEFDPRTQESITSLLSLDPTPKRVTARNNFTRNGTSVKIGDLLEVRSINYDEDSGEPLHVTFRTMAGKEVVLTEYDTEQFSLRLSLTSEKMEPALAKCVFPQRVYLYPHSNKKYTSNNKPYTLLERRQGQMLVTYVYEDKITYVGVDDTTDALVEIPLDLDIELEILGKPENRIYETKEEIYQAFKDVRKFVRKEEDYGVIADYVRKGKHVELPAAKSSTGMAFLNSQMQAKIAPATSHSSNVLKQDHSRVKKELGEEKKRNAELERMANKLDDIIKGLNEKCETKERYIKDLLAERNLPPLPQTGQKQQQSYGPSGEGLYTSVDERYYEPKAVIQKENKPPKMLDDYTVQDVKELLVTLNLSQYVDKFAEEGVNGEILSVLDGPILEKDLGVKSGLHQKKILKITEKLMSQHDISHYMSLDSVKQMPTQEGVYHEL